MTETATVTNGNKNYFNRVFVIVKGKIIKSFDTNIYLKSPQTQINHILDVRQQHFRSKAW